MIAPTDLDAKSTCAMPTPEEKRQTRSTAIVRLLEHVMNGSNINLVEEVDELLELIGTGDVTCTCMRDEDKWWAKVEGEYHELSGTLRDASRLRSICARLAVLSHDTTGIEAFLYGGEGDIVLEQHGQSRRFHVKTMNTPGQQWFEITPMQDAAS